MNNLQIEMLAYGLNHNIDGTLVSRAAEKTLELLSIKQVYPFQEISTRIGHVMNKHGIEAHLVGADMLYSLKTNDFTIMKHKDSVILKGKYSLLLSSKERKQREDKHSRRLLPYLSKPTDWTTNTTHGSVITGKGNNLHNGKQALDVLNTLQKISWTHTPVITDCEPTHTKNGTRRTSKELDQCKRFNVEYLGTKFWFLWKFDKRGRSYSSGYDLNLQSSEYRKATIQFAVEKELTDEGRYWLRVDMANAFGSRKSFDKQAELGNHILNNPDWYLARAKEPYLLKKAVLAYEKGTTGHNMFLDASTSGLQIMAVLASCRATAERVNVIGKKRKDAYNEFATDFNMERDVIKYPIMTHYYNSIKVPKSKLGTHYKDFIKQLADSFPGAEDIKEILNNCWNSNKNSYEWTMPDEHVCKIKVIVEHNTVVKLTGNKKEFEYKYKYYENECSDNGTEILANIIHSIDAYIAREMIRKVTNRKGTNNVIIAHIHDAFTFHPNDAPLVIQAYKEILADIHDSNLLADIVYQLSGQHIGITKEITRDEILASVYALN